MKIFLLRHAQAENTYPDFDRALTKFGHKQIEKLAAHLNPEIFDNLGEIWHSPYLRATQSKEDFQSLFHLKAKSVSKDNILPESDFKSFAKELCLLPKSSKDILIVSHNFFLEELLNLLLFGEGNNLNIPVKKASLSCLELNLSPKEKRPYGLWSLKFTIYPKLF